MNLEKLETLLGETFGELLQRPLAQDIKKILASGDKRLYALWLTQVAHLTKHTSLHQAMVGLRPGISHPYMKFCFEHAAEEVGHEMMAIHDLRKIGVNVKTVDDLPTPLPATTQLNSYLYYAAQNAHPNTRLGFSYWAEKCYPYIDSLASGTKSSLGLSDSHMTFFVSHAAIDEKHAADVEKIVALVCKDAKDWAAVEDGMVTSLNLAVEIFAQIYQTVTSTPGVYADFLKSLEK